MEKYNVILDTDIGNAWDDQFALAYLLKSQEKFNIEAITIAPYQHINESIEENQNESLNEILEICNLLKIDISEKIFKGSTDFRKNGYNKLSDAANKIIQIALKNEKTYILAIGAITNVAIAILKEPKIIEKIEIIWLGGNDFKINKNNEFNFIQDVQAVNDIINSNTKITIIPGRQVGAKLRLSTKRLRKELSSEIEICNHLYNRFCFDKFHGAEDIRSIWDVSVVAYLINKKWFEVEKINLKNIENDFQENLNYNKIIINRAKQLNKEEILKDLFEKLNKD